jgi:hypothetical protein
MLDKEADLAGPGIGDYNELEKTLPKDYSSLLTPKETQEAIYIVKNYIEEGLCKELNLMMVSVPAQFSFTFLMIMARILSMARLSRPQPNGNGWR